MEVQPSDSKKLFKVFDASKRKRTRKKREGDDSNSMPTDDSTGGCRGNGRRISSAQASLQDTRVSHNQNDGIQDNLAKRDSSPSTRISQSPIDVHRPRSPRRHRRITRDGISLALKAGLTSTPRSTSPIPQIGDDVIDSTPRDQDSFIYAYLEEAIKRDKKKHRHTRRLEERHCISRDAEEPALRERHHHRRHRDEYRERDKSVKDDAPSVDQVALFETLAKLCAQMTEKSALCANVNDVPRTKSHKSLQCETVSKREQVELDQRPVRLPSRELSRDNLSPSRTRSNVFQNRSRSRDDVAVPKDRNDKCGCCDPYFKQQQRYSSKINVRHEKPFEGDRYQDHPLVSTQTRSYVNDNYRTPIPDHRDVRNLEDQQRNYDVKQNFVDRRNYDDKRNFDDRRRHCDDRRIYDERKDYDNRTTHDVRKYYDDRRRSCERKTSRSFDDHREQYIDDNRNYRRTARSDEAKDKRYDERDYRDRRYEEGIRDKSYESKETRERNSPAIPTKDRKSRRNLDRFEKASIASRDEEYRDKYRDRDKYSEREPYSGASVVDGDTSTVSAKSNYLKVVKQEISEQREAMDKMMKLWKELMRCFKGISQTQGATKPTESAANNMRESAAAQLRLWRECMRRYETVARDVGDTDARLMEEINKQRSEMAEMATMWQECLQRYRDMSNDFNSLKQQLATAESPTRAPAAPPVTCAEGEGPPAAPYRLPPNYPPVLPIPPGYPGGSPLRSRASAPPAWWWGGEELPPRRRSSPDSQRSRERHHRHKNRDRDDTRYKEKPKPSGARSEHRHRKR